MTVLCHASTLSGTAMSQILFFPSLQYTVSVCTVHTSDVLKTWIHMDPNYLAGFNIIYKAEFDNGECVCYGMFS